LGRNDNSIRSSRYGDVDEYIKKASLPLVGLVSELVALLFFGVGTAIFYFSAAAFLLSLWPGWAIFAVYLFFFPTRELRMLRCQQHIELMEKEYEELNEFMERAG